MEQYSQFVLDDDRRSADVFRREVLDGLSRQPKSWPCKFLYDYKGSLLFDRICDLEEYYVTRTEISILKRYIGEIGDLCGSGCAVVEFGSGSGIKTRLLLDALRDPVAYVPIDISKRQLLESAAALMHRYPSLEVLPVCADYTASFRLPSESKAPRRTVVFFPGSTIGNFEPAEAIVFLRRMSRMCGTDGAVLIGVDFRKPRAVLERAYNDAQGVTAAFNLNILRRINRELGANFDLDQFTHRAVYNDVYGRIEMRLISRSHQTVNVDGALFGFRRDEFVTTEHSYKYAPDHFADLAKRAGLAVHGQWTDPRRWFGIYFLKPA